MTKNRAAYYIVVRMLNPSCRMKHPRLLYFSATEVEVEALCSQKTYSV